ncbi:carbohydrate ABC transporter permease [Protaetiibacter intestinalis]|uniref:Sugar ABC transporter permease n=1 Tax=Protaetiibacter intestinalis TaxID=2419774 RepID=A0A387B3M2_9MICO|nr:sugar ABC transporter permease [Protaetiibacter intestinalis]AYF96907.1 sugar ABC transporter permease [Protaetiibacter intestinalis]
MTTLTGRQRLANVSYRATPYVYISPFFILFAVVGLFPLVYTAWVSLHEWSLIGGDGGWVGLDNYAAVLGDRKFWIALRNSLSIFLLSSVPQLIFALLIASALDTNLRGKTFWRMGVLLPYVVAPVAVALIFGQLFADQFGAINNLLSVFGIGPVGWHVDPLASHVAIATMVNFRWTGYNSLVLLAAMQAIPRDYYEAAVIDGAGRIRQFLSVTIPGIRPTLIFVIITSTIGGLQIFDEPRLYDQFGLGGADSQWLTLTLYLYNLGWDRFDFGKASAVAWLLFLVIAIFGLINLLASRRISTEGTK